MSNTATMMGLGSGGGTPVPDAIGAEYGGGYYAGTLIVDASTSYYLIVAPKSSGQNTSKKFKTSNSSSSYSESQFDGAANTAGCIEAGASLHPAADFCDTLSIGGYNDWYLPSRYESEILFYNLKPGTYSNNTSMGINPYSDPARTSNYTSSVPGQTSASIFQLGGSEAFGDNYDVYNSSTATNTASYKIYFNIGQLFSASMTDAVFTRAIRRVLI